MTPALLAWLQFATGVAIVGWAGFRLVRLGDTIAEKTGLSRSWVGMVMVATVTSLPELATGLGAVAVAQAPDIAAGDALGSCTFNLLMVVLLDAGSRQRTSAWHAIGPSHRLAVFWALALLAIAAAGILLPQQLPAIGHASLASFLLVIAYLAAVRSLSRIERTATAGRPAAPADVALRQALVGYALGSVAIIAAGTWVAVVSVEVARVMGWSNSFMGTTLVALATSVPELATTLASIRIGALELALGNLLGSNLFDLLILALDDFAYLRAPLFASISPAHLGTVLTAMTMNAVLLAAAAAPPRARLLGMAGWPAFALLALYLLNAAFHFAVA